MDNEEQEEEKVSDSHLSANKFASDDPEGRDPSDAVVMQS